MKIELEITESDLQSHMRRAIRKSNFYDKLQEYCDDAVQEILKKTKIEINKRLQYEIQQYISKEFALRNLKQYNQYSIS